MPLQRTIVAFSHLRWKFVYQRPQHVLSRLAARHRVVFIEEPTLDPDGLTRWEITEQAPGLQVFRPRTPNAEAGFSAAQLDAMAPLVDELRNNLPDGDLVAWLYTPLAVPLARALGPDAVVYDCMDELSLFRGAPPELLTREVELLDWADLVFTGGRSLYRAKQGRHPNIHCFPSSVDAAHFGQARRGASPLLPEPPDQAPLPEPRLGYFGVLDERIDVEVVDTLARAHPEWQIVLVGPIAKVDPATFPRYPNVVYTGQRDYGELPAYLSGWSVCLLPFARNDATRFISPTKILEYMAAEHPIVSTPIADVAGPYGDFVYLADTPHGFVRACEEALHAPDADRARRVERMRVVLSSTSWEATVAGMDRLVSQALSRSASVRKP